MHLDPREREELAAFFAKRLTPELRPRTPGEAPDVRAWERLLDGPRLAAVVREAAAVLPDDANLQAVVTELVGRPAWSPAVVLGASVGAVAALLVIVTVGGASVLASSSPEAIAAVEAPAETTPVAIAPTVEPESAKVTAEPAADAVVAKAEAQAPSSQALGGEAEVAEAPAREEAPAARAGMADEKPQVGTTGAARCTSKPGEIVGYWHAGETPPGRAGDTLEMPHGRNVRADYPDVHNRFDARAEVQCQLHRADRVKLTREPIRVPGGHYWVPLMHGDLLGGQS